MGDLITLPLRLTVRAASLWLRATEEVVSRTLAVADRVTSREGAAASETPAPARARTEEPPEPSPPEASSPPPAPAPPSSPPISEEPAHVSEEAVLVEELAESGAEDGAGAQVRIDEPWDGYAQLSAEEVIARLGDASAEELAAINLYESANRARATVLSAVERQLELISRNGPSQ